MRTTRIFHPSELSRDQETILAPQAAVHLVRVLRIRTGARIVLFNGDGNEYIATVIEIERKRVRVQITDIIAVDNESPLNITLVQGVSRPERMDYTLQKAVELGVKKIVPVITEFCSVQLKADRLEKRLRHWQGVITSACEQSGRTLVPEISLPCPFKDWLTTVDPKQTCLTLSPRATNSLQTITVSGQDLLLLVGPEGGLSQTEMDTVDAQGFLGIRLGPRVLRTETAALVAISIIQSRWGDLG